MACNIDVPGKLDELKEQDPVRAGQIQGRDAWKFLDVVQKGLRRDGGRGDSRRRHGLHPRTLEPKLRVQKIALREIRMPLVTPFETSFGRVTDRRMLLVQAESDGVTGWGECVAGEGPFYTPERRRLGTSCATFWPTLKKRNLKVAVEIWDMLISIRGHNMAKAGIEAAVWDAEAKQKTDSFMEANWRNAGRDFLRSINWN